MENKPLLGLTSEDAKSLQKEYGRNQLVPEEKSSFIKKLLKTLSEPMFILLFVAATIYFILGEPRDGAIMLIFVVGIISIDVIQEWKTDKTLHALKDLSSPQISVIRDGIEKIIDSRDIVPGDLMLIAEGNKIPADGVILKLNDLCIEESSLTGEPAGVWKEVGAKPEAGSYWRRDYCYAGTQVTQGNALIQVDKIGAHTEYGKVSTDIAEAPERPTPLEKQTRKLVKLCALIGSVLFVLVGLVTFINLNALSSVSDKIVHSVLAGVTLAMAMIPEEFPVILTVFLSMGAWRLAKRNALIRRLPSVETLGSVSVLCVDKTGTLTKNIMKVEDVWTKFSETDLIKTMGMACECEPYDPMEKAMLTYCESKGIDAKTLFCNEFIAEYSFTPQTKMMGHIYKINGETLLTAKGSPESILALCGFAETEAREIDKKQIEMASRGLRVIAVATTVILGKIKPNLQDNALTFCGLVGLADPPREEVPDAIKICNKAGIRVVMITGDNGLTATSIAKKIGLMNDGNVITGAEIDEMDDEQLKEKIVNCNVFSRVVPKHKMRIVKAFKELGEIVAMTGDGVNDAPALKYADIGIAMGKRSTDVAREAADMVLLDDNFTTIVDTVRDGRRIYTNIRKAIGYVFVIHIPIALASLFAPLMGIPQALAMLLPLHVVLLELVIDPTCSIVLERTPAEPNIMDQKPIPQGQPLVNKAIVIKSLIQGLIIFAATFGTYLYIWLGCKTQAENAHLIGDKLTDFLENGAMHARTMAFIILIVSNLLLVLVNSSEFHSIITCAKNLFKEKLIIIINGGIILIALIAVYTPLSTYLKFTALEPLEMLSALGTSIVAVLWYEIVKLFKNRGATKTH